MNAERLFLFVRRLMFYSIALLFCGCNEDPDLFGTNEEVPVIFARLNYHDTVNFIRISRTVQPDEGFTRRNSNFYHPDSLRFHWKYGIMVPGPAIR
jgi:hypothetical protein